MSIEQCEETAPLSVSCIFITLSPSPRQHNAESIRVSSYSNAASSKAKPPLPAAECRTLTPPLHSHSATRVCFSFSVCLFYPLGSDGSGFSATGMLFLQPNSFARSLCSASRNTARTTPQMGRTLLSKGEHEIPNLGLVLLIKGRF